jgi:hypothetical protein
MDNQHKKIAGYRDLSQHEIDLMNAIKAKGEELDALLNQARTHLEIQRSEAIKAGSVQPGDINSELQRIDRAQPVRWLSIARTDLQTGIMAAVRAVAQPTTF